MGKQLTFSLACAAVLAAAVVPGTAGYLSARLESVEAAEHQLRSLELRLQRGQASMTRTISWPQPCEMASPLPTVPPAAAFVPAPEFKPKKRAHQPIIPERGSAAGAETRE
ncbi:hypothetical protein [Nonomuraea soli]|uniref:Uncharacterized protein n=1 Tax=Nonomuraea soli TaxID=1032476 RepID=A0A7W0CHM6_9ACTN|nr:hypothetical protein [Nonomuraea soli]MBA2891319.1 hypothetical protein [Nonomuraea soli]